MRALEYDDKAILPEQKSLRLGPATKHAPPLPAATPLIESASPVRLSSAKLAPVRPSDNEVIGELYMPPLMDPKKARVPFANKTRTETSWPPEEDARVYELSDKMFDTATAVAPTMPGSRLVAPPGRPKA
jgi:hypothetical protein